jgi:hypothetical protein
MLSPLLRIGHLWRSLRFLALRKFPVTELEGLVGVIAAEQQQQQQTQQTQPLRSLVLFLLFFGPSEYTTRNDVFASELQSACAAAQSLAQLRSLTRVRIEFYFEQPRELQRALVSALARLPALSHLMLSGTCRMLSDDFAPVALMPALTSLNLREFCYRGMPDAPHRYGDAFVSAVAAAPKLTHLNLLDAAVDLTVQGFQTLERSQVHTLHASFPVPVEHLPHAEHAALAEALLLHSYGSHRLRIFLPPEALLSLDRYYRLTPRAFEILASSRSSIESLLLSHFALHLQQPAAHWISIGRSLAAVSTLTSLRISMWGWTHNEDTDTPSIGDGQHLPDEGWAQLLEMPNLRSLWVYGIRDNSLPILATLFSPTMLQRFIRLEHGLEPPPNGRLSVEVHEHGPCVYCTYPFDTNGG